MAKILIVDDHGVNREFLVTLLGYQNHRLLEASDGAEALAIIRSERPDLVITDILMPTMDGYEFVHQLRADPAIASTAVIFFTAHYHKQEAQSLARSCGVGHILTKPCEPELILRIVEEALGTPLQITAPWSPQNFDHEHLRVVTDKLSQTADELQIPNQRLAALIEVNMQLASERDPRQLLKNVCRIARALIGAKYAVLAVGNQDNGNHAHFVTSGMDAKTADGLGSPGLREGVVGSAFTERKSRRISNPGGDPWTVGLPAHHPPVHTLLVAPIESRVNVHGWICLTNKIGAEEFSNEDEQLLTILAAQVGRIYENGSLYIEIQKHAARLEREIDERKRAQDALSASEEKYRVILETTSDAIVLMDVNSVIRYANHGLEQTFGYAPEEIIGKELSILQPERLWQRHREGLRRYLDSGVKTLNWRATEVIGVHRDGYEFPVEIAFSDMMMGGERLFAGYLRDMTERKQAEEKVRRLNRVYAVLSGINSLIVRVRDRQELFDGACRIAVEHGGFGIAWIGMLDPQTLDITPMAWAGLEAKKHLENIKSSAGVDHPMGQGVVGRAIRERTPIFSNNLLTETGPGGGRRSEAIRLGYLSRIALPLLMDNDAVGVIVLFAKEKDFFTEGELKLLSELAGDISFALDHIGKEKKLGKLSRIRTVSSDINAAIVRIRERDTLLQEICRIAVEHGMFKLVWIALLDQKMQKVQPIAWAGFSSEIAHAVDWKAIRAAGATLAEVMRTRKIAVRNNIESEERNWVLRREALKRGCRSTVCLPLVVDDTVVAAIILFAAGTNFFDEDELGLLNEVASDVSFALQSIAQQEKLNYLAYYDALTGLPNRALLHERLTHELHSAKRDGGKTAVLMLCVKRFRHINETLGRHAGDAVLRELAQRLQQCWPGPENVARIGGDGFAGILSNVKDVSEIAHLFEKALTCSFDLPFTVDGKELTISIAAGIAVSPADGEDADTLLRNAEAALKKTKVAGERYLFYEPRMNATVAATLMLENKLRRALEKEQFVLHYQPKVELSTGRIAGLEALIRWNDPETGLVPPAHFIPLLEETGLILDAGRWAIRKALADYREWDTQGLQPTRIAVNVSPLQLRQKDFVEMVRNTIAESKVVPHGLDLEITESLIMEDIEGNIRKLKALRDMGLNIAIDDFGTGYSSLGYLARLPVNALKIDRSFIITMNDDPDSMTIVSMIISLAHSLALKVVAEGVETEEQSRFLKLLKCDELQGYLFSKPLPAEQLTKMLDNHNNAP